MPQVAESLVCLFQQTLVPLNCVVDLRRALDCRVCYGIIDSALLPIGLGALQKVTGRKLDRNKTKMKFCLCARPSVKD